MSHPFYHICYTQFLTNLEILEYVPFAKRKLKYEFQTPTFID